MPAFLQAASSATRAGRAGLPSRSPNDTPEPPLFRISPFGPSMPEMRASPPATLSAPKRASSVAKWAWPFSMGTMVVSAPTAGAIASIADVEIVALAGQDHDVVRPTLARRCVTTLTGTVASPLRALHHQPVLPHRLGALLAQQEGDVDAGLVQARAPVAADRTGAQNQDLHFLMLRSATQSASQVARSSV